MFRKLHQQSIAFKLAHFAIIGALFFVQMQVSFIERAYNDDSTGQYLLKKQVAASSTGNDIASGHANDNTYSKLNKRYPLVYTYTACTPEQITQLTFAFAHLQYLYTSPFGIDNFKNAFSLRGPPAASIS